MKFENLKVELPGLNLKNPIMPASGCFGFGKEFSDLYDINCLGAIVLKSITREPRYGNPLPRVCETSSGMLNAIGLQNPGVDEFIKIYIPWLEQLHTNIIANIAGSSIEDYIEVIKKLNVYDCIQAFELNISCPNVKKGGIAFGVEKEIAYEITKKCKEVSKKPLYVKLSPNVHNIVEIAKEVERAKADGIVLINTLLGMRFDLRTGKPILANQTGGLSGPAIMPVALRMVNQVANAVDIPIIGVGGISKSEDVLEFLLAGASAVQIGMHNFVDPYCCKKIIEELEVTIQKYGWKSVKEIVERK